MDSDLDLTGRRKDDPVPGYALRLRTVSRICGGLAGTVAILAFLSWQMTRQSGGRSIPGLPPAVPLLMSMLAAVLILLSSRLRSTVLRRAFPRSAALEPNPDVVLSAYGRATLLSFAVLETAAILGLAVSLSTGAASYGIILCVVSLSGMLTRWPRAGEVDRLLRGRTRP